MPEKARRVCSVPGCNRPHHARGLCQKHYDEFRKKDRRARRLARAGGGNRVRVCSVPGCNRPHHARGYCKLHYARFTKTGRAVPDAPAAPPDPRRNRNRFLAWRLELIRWRHRLLQTRLAEEAANELDED